MDSENRTVINNFVSVEELHAKAERDDLTYENKRLMREVEYEKGFNAGYRSAVSDLALYNKGELKK